MSYLVDKDVVADYLNGRSAAVQFLTGITSSYPAISIVTFGEIYDGIYFGRDPEKSERGFFAFLNEFDILSLDVDIMKRFAMIRGNLRRSGQLISDTDIMIAATAVHFGLRLVSHNQRHFRRVPDLEIVAVPPL